MADTVTDIARRPHAAETALVVTAEHLALLKKTFAAEATDAELELFVYDCKRRGVHPLDRMLHFTKRQGKYTPVVSIDFLRSRAADSGEHMGTDDALFEIDANGKPDTASVTVYRLVQGERVKFTATARMSEYLPGPPNDFMWRKMPFGQLAKCAEALALRKGFPQETADLHTTEEMDQAGDDVAPVKKAPVRRASEQAAAPAPAKEQSPSAPPQPTPPAKQAPPAAQQPSAPKAPAAPSPAPIEGTLVSAAGPVVTIKTIKAKQEGKSDMHVVMLAGDRTEYTTFSQTVAQELNSFKGTSSLIMLEYTKKEVGTRTYHNITGFRIHEPAPPAAAAPTPAAAEPKSLLDDADDFEP